MNKKFDNTQKTFIYLRYSWGLIRASNTQPVLVMRFEAETKEALEEYEQSFRITLGGVR